VRCEPLSQRGDYGDFEIHSGVPVQDTLDSLQL